MKVEKFFPPRSLLEYCVEEWFLEEDFLQPLKFAISCDAALNATIFPCTVWAGYLEDWPGPAEGERPTGYIVLLLDKDIRSDAGCDHGIAAQSIVLGAMARGLGACMIGSVKRRQLAALLGVPGRYEILLVIALGVPAETVVLEAIGPSGSIEYYRAPDDTHHVPKRSLDELIVG